MDDGPNPAGTWRPPVRVAVATALTSTVATTALALPGRLVGGEAGVLEAANGLPRWAGAPLELGMHVGTSVGALVLVVVGLVARKRRVAVAGLLAWLLGRLATAVLKEVVDRPRPSGLVADVVLRQHLPSDAGFPSAHATTAAALAVVAAWGWPRLGLPLALGAVLVGVARLYVGVHLPLDVLGGWAIGLLVGIAAIAVVHPRVRPHPEPAPWSRRRATQE